jgi:hypothetical protein
MHYVLPANPASPKSSLKRLRENARRAGYLIAADYVTGTFTLVDARLRLPLLGLDHVGLPAIAHAIQTVRAEKVSDDSRSRAFRRPKAEIARELRAIGCDIIATLIEGARTP